MQQVELIFNALSQNYQNLSKDFYPTIKEIPCVLSNSINIILFILKHIIISFLCFMEIHFLVIRALIQ